jgi:hypothetical protein
VTYARRCSEPFSADAHIHPYSGFLVGHRAALQGFHAVLFGRLAWLLFGKLICFARWAVWVHGVGANIHAPHLFRV